MNRLPDPRRKEQCVYTQAHLLWTGLLLFLTHLGSRRQLRVERLAEAFAGNLTHLCGQQGLDEIADPDTLAYYAERIAIEPMHALLASMTADLIRMRALDPFRLQGYLPVAIDGSQLCTFDHEPWPGCPHRERSNGTRQFFAYTLDAKLVTSNDMALSMATEALTNEGNIIFDKQDCELKAFPRLVEKLHAFFPRTPLCLLLDGLYANQNVIRLIEAKGWKYIITFKEGSMPERFREAQTLAHLQTQNRIEVEKTGLVQRFAWAELLPIAEFTPNVLFCHEHADTDRRFVWLTNFQLNRSNVERIATKGGRLRWKVENEGFNVQKNNGYEMQHPYSEHANGFQVFYILLLMAHYIAQLILHGNLIESLCKTFGSAKNFARRLAESLRFHLVPDDLIMPGQIRFRPP